MNKRPEVDVDNGIPIIDGKPIPLRNIRIDSAIESGAHGSVFAGVEAGPQRKIAVKIWYRVGEKVRDGAIAEVSKLASVAHPLFVTVYQLDVVESSPYSTMEFLPGPSLKNWLRTQDRRRISGRSLFDHLRTNSQDLRQRCKFWFLYSVGLKYLYAQGMLHGDPHLGNIIVFEDTVGISRQLLAHHILKVSDLLSIKMLDLGTSLFRMNPHQIKSRESNVILESAERLFPDFGLRQVMNIDLKLEPEVMLRVLDKYVEYVLERSAVPGMTKRILISSRTISRNCDLPP